MSVLSLLLKCRLFLFVKGVVFTGFLIFLSRLHNGQRVDLIFYFFFFEGGLLLWESELHIKTEIILDFN
jgi:hypothetical protein